MHSSFGLARAKAVQPARDIGRAAAVATAASLVACIVPHGATSVRDEPLHPELPPVPEQVLAPGTPLPSHPGLSAVVHAPARTPYELRAFGGARVSVDVRLLNRGDRALSVSPLELTYAVRREGVSFACGEPEGPAVDSREPSHLAPGQSFSYE